MSYLSESLGPDEQIVAKASLHWIVFAPGVLLLAIGILFWPMLILGALSLLFAIIRKSTTELAITNKKVLAKWGVISRSSIEQRLDKVDSIEVQQGLLGRLLDYGSIRVNGSGLTATPVPGISDPLAFRRAFERALDGGPLPSRPQSVPRPIAEGAGRNSPVPPRAATSTVTARAMAGEVMRSERGIESHREQPQAAAVVERQDSPARTKWRALIKYDEALASIDKKISLLGDKWVEVLASKFTAPEHPDVEAIVAEIVPGALAEIIASNSDALSKWQALIAFDDELAAADAAVREKGDFWIRQLAADYVAINEKDYLPRIVAKFCAEADKRKSQAEEMATPDNTALESATETTEALQGAVSDISPSTPRPAQPPFEFVPLRTGGNRNPWPLIVLFIGLAVVGLIFVVPRVSMNPPPPPERLAAASDVKPISPPQPPAQPEYQVPVGTALIAQSWCKYKAIESVALTKDGHYLLAGSDDSSIRLWDLQSGRMVRKFNGRVTLPASVAFSPDGRMAIATSAPDQVKVWNTADGEMLYYVEMPGAPYGAAFSSTGDRFAAGGDGRGQGTIRIWDASRGQLLLSFANGNTFKQVLSLDFSPDGRWLAAGAYEHDLKIWNTATGQAVHNFSGHTSYVKAVKYSVDGKFLISGSEDATVKIWDVDSERLLHDLAGHTDRVSSVAFSLDGQQAYSASDDSTIKIWDVASERLLRDIPTGQEKIWAAAFSANVIASGGLDGTIKIWNTRSGSLLATFRAQDACVQDTPSSDIEGWVGFTPNGLFTGEGDVGRLIKIVVTDADGVHHHVVSNTKMIESNRRDSISILELAR
ncbi:PH domain-containing protein [uncultured Rhodoblastus sp.]|uniref:WD40 domain-containing protein n=1 Tax=uncultured Rhodoblastus sp. TaxID=543037 RepID=UPI0025D55266|nr:PH domain-containing protein [uncultured Rhodoblastus sp.]